MTKNGSSGAKARARGRQERSDTNYTTARRGVPEADPHPRKDPAPMAVAPEVLPHDSYVDAVAHALASYGIDVIDAFTTTPDGETLDGVLRFAETDIDPDEWPHGVYLGWDQHTGWQLIESGGGRNVTDLDPEGVGRLSSPLQVACSTANALRGHMATGPICNDGTWSWDERPLEAAIAAWEAAGL